MNGTADYFADVAWARAMGFWAPDPSPFPPIRIIGRTPR